MKDKLNVSWNFKKCLTFTLNTWRIDIKTIDIKPFYKREKDKEEKNKKSTEK